MKNLDKALNEILMNQLMKELKPEFSCKFNMSTLSYTATLTTIQNGKHFAMVFFIEAGSAKRLMDKEKFSIIDGEIVFDKDVRNKEK